jgi:hypothetical protein
MKYKNGLELAFHPFLIFAYPFLFLVAHNPSEIPIGFVPKTIFIPFLLIAAILWIVGRWMKSTQKAGLSLTIGILIYHFFIFGKNIPYQAGVAAALTSLGLAGIWFIVKSTWAAIPKNATIALNLVSAVLIAWNAIDWTVQVTKGHGVAVSVREAQRGEFKLALSRKYGYFPDIYYIVLDGYGRQDVLGNLYDFDNSEFVRYLRKKGFFVGDESKSNYAHTILSMASSLNFTYLDDVARKTSIDSVNWTPLASLIKENKIETLLTSIGYKTVYFHLGIYNFDDHSKDFYIKDSTQFDDLEVAVERDMDKRNINTRKKVLNVLDNLPRLKHIEEPKFVYAHILSPHDPFVFGPDGEELNPKGQFEWMQDPLWQFGPPISKADYIKGYAQQVSYLNKRLKVVIESLLENREKPPIIIIQGDHGPKSNFHWNDPDKTDVYERMGILNALFIPGSDLSLKPDISPVNTFRIVLNEVFDGGIPMLPDLSYYSGYDSPYLMYNVTRKAEKAPSP